MFTSSQYKKIAFLATDHQMPLSEAVEFVNKNLIDRQWRVVDRNSGDCDLFEPLGLKDALLRSQKVSPNAAAVPFEAEYIEPMGWTVEGIKCRYISFMGDIPQWRSQ